MFIHLCNRKDSVFCRRFILSHVGASAMTPLLANARPLQTRRLRYPSNYTRRNKPIVASPSIGGMDSVMIVAGSAMHWTLGWSSTIRRKVMASKFASHGRRCVTAFKTAWPLTNLCHADIWLQYAVDDHFGRFSRIASQESCMIRAHQRSLQHQRRKESSRELVAHSQLNTST